ncbi:flagellar hook-basal body complex protein FliE [Clostridium oceanicum]|uniref:Flagellar hook-basal body complex protein FliE n=1 Tax=Clostridium oceanicum TaxID=1543 RepID=A0ABN1JTB3_9CLOT
MIVNGFVPNSSIFNFDDNKTKNVQQPNNIDFFKTLKNEVDKVNTKQIKSEETTQNFIKGKEQNVHNVMLNSEEAKMSMELAVQVRNKLLEAYQELNRMQL